MGGYDEREWLDHIPQIDTATSTAFPSGWDDPCILANWQRAGERMQILGAMTNGAILERMGSVSIVYV